MRESGPVLERLPELNFIDDKEGKPVGINSHIGKLDKALDLAGQNHWLVVDIKRDWSEVYPPKAE